MSNIEFRNNLTEGTSVKGKKERTQYGALGTPKGRITTSEKLSPILIFCFRFERYDLIHNKTAPSRPNQSCKQSYKREWSIVSNAADRSNNVRATAFPESTEKAISF